MVRKRVVLVDINETTFIFSTGACGTGTPS
jgi:hypothetical protein